MSGSRATLLLPIPFLLNLSASSSAQKIEGTSAATCAISTAATNSTSGEKSERDANKPTLVQRAQGGNAEAFAALFQFHRSRVYSVCLSMTRDVAEAEDLTQDTYLQAFRSIGTFRGGSAFSTWLHRVAVNTVLMELRRRKSPPILSLDEPLSPDSPSLEAPQYQPAKKKA